MRGRLRRAALVRRQGEAVTVSRLMIVGKASNTNYLGFYEDIYGTIDRVTGDVNAFITHMNPQTDRIILSLTYVHAVRYSARFKRC